MNYLQKKKLAFMSIVNQIKGFIRTVSGIFPLTLPNCVDDKSITKYLIYGNSVQNGTPTPDNPVEVESVGERTKNLFDINNFESLLDGQGRPHIDISSLEVGSTYTISANDKLVFKINKEAGVGMTANGGTQSGIVTSFTFTMTETYKSLGNLYLFSPNYALLSKKTDVEPLNIQLEQGSIATEYEPYGYKIPITVSGKNLFNENDYFASELLNVGSGYVGYEMQLKPNTTYAVSVTSNNSTMYVHIRIGATTNVDTACWLSHRTNDYLTLKPNATKNFTTTDNGLVYLCVAGGGAVRLDEVITGLQIEEGTTATDYQPYHEPITTNIYLDEPLRKVGNYADYIDFENGKVVRQVGEVQYDENGSYSAYYYNDSRCGFYAIQRDMKQGVRQDGFCNYLHNRAGNFYNSDTWFGVNTNAIYLFLKDIYNSADTDAERIQALKDWLANLETPFLIYYILATPTETPISLPNIPTFKGTSVISADTTIQPSNAEIKYYSNVKE